MSFFELAPRLYEVFRLAAKLFRDGNEVRFMRLKKTQQCGEHRGVVDPAPELVGPDSGQVEEALRPTIVAKRCDKRS
jgi:hypothetical protein